MVFLLKNQIGCPNNKIIPSNSPKTLSGNHLNLRSDLISETSLTPTKTSRQHQLRIKKLSTNHSEQKLSKPEKIVFFVGFTNVGDLDVWSTSNSKSVKHCVGFSHCLWFSQSSKLLHSA